MSQGKVAPGSSALPSSHSADDFSPSRATDQNSFRPDGSALRFESNPRQPQDFTDGGESRGTRRKQPPAPLQSSRPFNSTIPIDSSNSPRSPKNTTNLEQPRSPRERLDDLLAAERPDVSRDAVRPPPAQRPSLDKGVSIGLATTQKISSYAQLRNVSAPVLKSGGATSPTSSANMQAASRPGRPDPRPAPPRNPSIDSAVSSISSTSQSYKHKGSQDQGNPPDPAALIAAAGSAEAVILNLWKEKQSSSSHNAQLWRLVEKQRAMILGLNKDLERALKDKERYRKKLKEQPAAAGPPPRADGPTPQVADRELSQSPAQSEKVGEPPSASAAQKAQRPARKESLKNLQAAAGMSPADSEAGQSPALPSEPGSAAESLKGSVGDDVSPTDVRGQLVPSSESSVPQVAKPTPTVAESKAAVVTRKPVAPQLEIPIAAAPSAAQDGGLQPPTLSITNPTPIVGVGEFPSPVQPHQQRLSQTLRKAPPAPLNLSLPIQRPDQPDANEEAIDSDPEVSDVEEIPIVERGRRKTREEDDRIREIIAIKEEEARSQSAKKKKSKSKSKTPGEGSQPNSIQSSPASMHAQSRSPVAIGLPASPRLNPAPGSIDALISPSNSDASGSIRRTTISPPLLSPGLPVSPRPGDRPVNAPQPRAPKAGLVSPPLSPRPPKHPIPLPNHPPPAVPVTAPAPTAPAPTVPAPPAAEAQPEQTPGTATSLLRPPASQSAAEGDGKGGFISEPSSPHQIYRGLITEQYPGLLLPPNALPSINIKVFSSRLRPSRNSFMALKPIDEDPVFILAIYARSDGKQLWRVEKTIAALPSLDQQLRVLCDFQGRLPDRSLFNGHAPAKIDARRAALNAYFDMILETPMNEMAALVVCEFFSTDVIGAEAEAPLKEAIALKKTSPKEKVRKDGYLTKRGKNFGGWKARYFLLENAELRYYESPGGAHLGTIKLLNAQIGKQSAQQGNQSPSRREDGEDNQYRHAFLILEPKRKDSNSLVRHVLCAESDEERDEWVEALMQHVDGDEERNQSRPDHAKEPTSPRSAEHGKSGHEGERRKLRKKDKDSPDLDRADALRAMSYEDTVAAQEPIHVPHRADGMPSPTHSTFSETTRQSPHPHQNAPSPSHGLAVPEGQNWGAANRLAAPTSVKEKKRSIFAGFKGMLSDHGPLHHHGGLMTPTHPAVRSPEHRMVFGLPLADAVTFANPEGVSTPLPAVVYRCLEYLQAKNASREEGIFRLSGSNIVIKALRERFNSEGDVKLLDGQYYDVHAVASLLKLYLRELPNSILTRDLHLDFLKVLGMCLSPDSALYVAAELTIFSDLDKKDDKIASFNVLVHRLPLPNRALIEALSLFLIEIVNNAEINKMTPRNGKCRRSILPRIAPTS